MQYLTPEEFLQLAQNPNGALPGLNKCIKSLKEASDADNRTLLRAALFLLHAIATTMPWDEESGLDARRFDDETNIVAPPWRECAGALLGVTFTKPDEPDDGE